MTSAKTNADIKELCRILRLDGIAKCFETAEQSANKKSRGNCRKM